MKWVIEWLDDEGRRVGAVPYGAGTLSGALEYAGNEMFFADKDAPIRKASQIMVLLDKD